MIKKIKQLIIEYFAILGYTVLCCGAIFGAMAFITDIIKRRNKR